MCLCSGGSYVPYKNVSIVLHLVCLYFLLNICVSVGGLYSSILRRPRSSIAAWSASILRWCSSFFCHCVASMIALTSSVVSPTGAFKPCKLNLWNDIVMDHSKMKISFNWNGCSKRTSTWNSMFFPTICMIKIQITNSKWYNYSTQRLFLWSFIEKFQKMASKMLEDLYAPIPLQNLIFDF